MKEMIKEIIKGLVPKKMSKEDWKNFVKECKEKLQQTKCLVRDNTNVNGYILLLI
ncbi:MAG: hypothetical protein HN524_06470 [Verrucomicrobia bacterium]|jgi:transcription elongation factor GreA-like protein|nr:hypothetical protein [Verrucomicrobiota bacterium]